MVYFTSSSPLNLYSYPLTEVITIDSITEQYLGSLYDLDNSIPLCNLNRSTYSKFLSEKIPRKCIGIYTIIRIDPMTNEWVFAYVGSSHYCILGRIVKFPRHLFGDSTSTDRLYQYSYEYFKKFGSNFENTFVHLQILGYNRGIDVKDKMLIDKNIRIIENNVIDSLKGTHYSAVANKGRAVCSMLSEQKRRSRNQKIEHTLYDV